MNDSYNSGVKFVKQGGDSKFNDYDVYTLEWCVLEMLWTIQNLINTILSFNKSYMQMWVEHVRKLRYIRKCVYVRKSMYACKSRTCELIKISA